MDVKLALSQMIGGQQQQPGQPPTASGELHDLHEKDIVQKQKLCMEILNVANKISPGKWNFLLWDANIDEYEGQDLKPKKYEKLLIASGIR